MNLKKSSLLYFLTKNGLTNFKINPVSVKTSWGNIINAHIANIEFISSLGNATKIVFQSSNDMYIKHGAFNYVKNNKNAFFVRPIYPGTSWETGKDALNDDKLNKFVNKNQILLVGSQIEGSFYEPEVLYKIIKIVKKEKLVSESYIYPREEVIFPTIALGLGLKPEALPYIFSEIHEFDKIFTFINRITSFITFGKRNFFYNALQKFHIFLLLKRTAISISQINRILKKDINWLVSRSSITENKSIITIYNINHIYGVKRVPRYQHSKIRRYIESLNTNE